MRRKGFDAMLSQFANEVLSYGPTAVLPQNLNDKWIKQLQIIADDFFDSNFSLDECKEPEDIGDPLLAACVFEILQYQGSDKVDINPKEMAEKVVIYALSIIMESVHRESDIGLNPPNLDDIFSVERIVAYKDTNPLFVNTLKRSCIIRESEKGWFQNIKDKLLSGVRGS
jgi:hypothetical protein